MFDKISREVLTTVVASIIVAILGGVLSFTTTKYSLWRSGVFYQISGPTDLVPELSDKKLPFKVVTSEGKDVPHAYLYTVTVRNSDGDIKNLKVRYGFDKGDSNFKIVHFEHAENANPEFPKPKPLETEDGPEYFRRFEYESLKSGDAFSLVAVTTEPRPLHLYTHDNIELKPETGRTSEWLSFANIAILILAVVVNTAFMLRRRTG